jgi:hypothetical protein
VVEVFVKRSQTLHIAGQSSCVATFFASDVHAFGNFKPNCGQYESSTEPSAHTAGRRSVVVVTVTVLVVVVVAVVAVTVVAVTVVVSVSVAVVMEGQLSHIAGHVLPMYPLSQKAALPAHSLGSCLPLQMVANVLVVVVVWVLVHAPAKRQSAGHLFQANFFTSSTG